ncbi:hypothetical protein G4X40_20985 [Rhodococcus sp. D2-41]|uniref:hypothetical protein n=1 Tax=Speluncibacter jeojiensis TaxID=2710754 RepID=UPI00240F7C18|nr:hypothetical protein [Rhodococcus sp. D2-41]MDG3012620.1 hypothetical protein [Rhodococcus sp. D2-41]
MANELADFLDPTEPELEDAWRSVASRADAGAGRQVNFIPAEVVLCLCAMRLVDHSRFGSSSASRAPFPVPELARLFKRPNSSILAKMANLDGSRPNGGKHDQAVFERLTAAPDTLDTLYRRMLRCARRQGVGPDLLPDFLDLLDFVEHSEPVHSGESRGTTVPSMEYPRWFHGIDGQVILDRTHVWITRDGVSGYPLPTEPRRAPLAAVRECRLIPSRRGSGGLAHILVDGAEDLAQDADCHPEAVFFGHEQRAEFELLAALLAPDDAASGRISTPEIDFLSALDRLDHVATAQEVLDAVIAERGLADGSEAAEKLAEALDGLDDDPRVSWAWVGEVWVAAGGTRPDEEPDRIAVLKALGSLVDTLPSDTGVTALFSAARGTAIAGLPHQRLAALWMALYPDTSEQDSGQDDGLVDSTPSRENAHMSSIGESDANSDVGYSVVRNTCLPQPTSTQASASRVEPPVAATPTVTRPPTRSALVGDRWRVYLDSAGFRTLAVCDPSTEAVEVTKGELVGRRFLDPTAAAAAVVERYEPGADAPADGWTAWTVDDGSGRSLAAVRYVIPTEVDHVQESRLAGGEQSTRRALGGASTADLGIAWFIEQIRDRGATATRVTGTRRTAVRVTVRGHDPIVVRVKTRTDGTWQASKTDENLDTDDTGAGFWAFVDLWLSPPAVFILQAKDVADGIRRATDAWVARDPRRERIGHHAIEPARVRYGRDRWDLLGLPQ